MRVGAGLRQHLAVSIVAGLVCGAAALTLWRVDPLSGASEVALVLAIFSAPVGALVVGWRAGGESGRRSLLTIALLVCLSLGTDWVAVIQAYGPPGLNNADVIGFLALAVFEPLGCFALGLAGEVVHRLHRRLHN